MTHDWRGWVGTLGLVAVLVSSWAYFASDGFDSDGGRRGSEQAAPAAFDNAEECSDTLPLQGCGVLPAGSLDLNFSDASPPMFIEVSQATGLSDGDAIQLLGTFTDIMATPPQSVVLQCVDDGRPGIEDCDVDGAEALAIQQRRFRVSGFAVSRELRVSDGRVVDCGKVRCYVVIAHVGESRAIASIRVSFDD